MKLAHQFDRGAAKKMFDDLGEKDIKKMNLTEDWQNKKLKWHKSYYCKNKKGEIVVATLLGDDILYSKELGGTLNIGYWDVLAPCDYDVLAHLETKAEWQAERIKELEKEIELKQRFINARNHPIYREERYRLQKASIDELTSLLKDCKLSIIKIYDRLRFSDENEITPADLINGIDDIKPMLYNIVTRLNAEIGESEEK